MSESLRELTRFSLASGDSDVCSQLRLRPEQYRKIKEALQYVDEALALDPYSGLPFRARIRSCSTRVAFESGTSLLKLKRDSPGLFTFPQFSGHSLLMLSRTRNLHSVIY
jgi:hypothetical protein